MISKAAILSNVKFVICFEIELMLLFSLSWISLAHAFDLPVEKDTVRKTVRVAVFQSISPLNQEI